MNVKSIIVILIFHAGISFSQIPNGDFENWQNVGGFDVPDGWFTNYCSTLSVPPCSAKDSNAFSGDFALRVRSTGAGIEGLMPGTVSVIAYSPDVSFNLSVYLKVDSLLLPGGYSAISVYQGAGPFFGNRIAYWRDTVNIPSFTNITLPVQLTAPDSFRVVLESGTTQGPLFTFGYCESVFDKVETTIATGTSDRNQKIIIFPNPSQQQVKIDCGFQMNEIMLFDLTGRSVLKQSVFNKSSSLLDVSKIQPGVYYLKINGVNINKTKAIMIE